VKLSMSS
jgi:hypothetical protein